MEEPGRDQDGQGAEDAKESDDEEEKDAGSMEEQEVVTPEEGKCTESAGPLCMIIFLS